jgi:chromate reductase, NAD(P)H dehydrogenase (quinone)
MRIVTLCGSHHSGSTNAIVLDEITRRLVRLGATVDPVDVSVDLPSFRPESVDQPPESVVVLRDAFGHADGVVVAVPEYAGGLPGWVKNITDWMVGAAAFYERPVAIASAATAGGTNAIEQLVRTLTWQGAYVVATVGIAAPLTIVRDRELTDATAIARLHELADLLAAVVTGERDVATATEAALAPLGLDLSDRPD